MPTRIFNDATEIAISNAYKSGASSTALSRHYECSHKTILSAVKRQGGSSRNASEAQRKYTCDHEFFASIDSEVKAYWLGFIAADGYISARHLSVKLARKDREHLVRLRSALQSSHPVADFLNDGYPASSIYIQSTQLAADLAAHGIHPRKSLTLKWAEHLQFGLLRHYLRGYFDGDGGWYIAKPYNPAHYAQLAFGIIGSWDFCRAAQRYLIYTAKVPTNTIKSVSRGKMAQLEYSGTLQASRIYKLLYDNATVWLPRKRDKASPYVRFDRRRTPRPTLHALSPEQKIIAKELKKTTQLTQREIAKRFGVHQATVSRALCD